MSAFVRRAPNRHVQRPTSGPTPRGDRRRAERAQLRRRSAMVGAPVLGAALAGGIILAFSGSSPAAPVTAVNASAAGLATWHHFSGHGGYTTVEDLGTVTGTYTLIGPGTVPDGAKVVFALTGPKQQRLVRTDSSAPYEVQIDTTKLTDGRYRLSVYVLGRFGTPSGATARYTLTIANSSAPAPTTSTTVPTTSTTPPETTTTPPETTTTTAPPETTTTAPTTSTSSPATTTPTHTVTVSPTTTTPTTRPATTRPSTTTPGTTTPPQVADVLAQTNAQRAANGCGALTIDSRLASAAQAHSADMAKNNYFAHNSQDGRSPFDRMTAAGYKFSTAGENIAMGYRTASDVMTGWMNSPGHRANILNCSFTNIGIGYAVNASGAPYWTQDFGRPA